MFKDFKNVKAREGTKREELVLEKLINMEYELFNDPELKVIYWYNNTKNYRGYIEDKIKTLKVNYDEKDIASLIRSSNLESDVSKYLFGLYTGCLLTKLTEERHAEGKTTNIVVDGVKQDYILTGTKKADYITINNCEGERIGSGIGAGNGFVKQVIINNCKGKNIGNSIGDFEGNVNQLIINDCIGNFIGQSIGYSGNVKSILIVNCKGKFIGWEMIGNGKANQVVINNCKGNRLWDNGKYSNNIKVSQAIINDPINAHKQGCDRIISLVNSIKSKNYQEIQEIARKIGEYSNV